MSPTGTLVAPGSGPVKPQGTRPPAPNWGLIALRTLLFLDLVLLIVRTPLLHWADQQPRLPAPIQQPHGPAGVRPAVTPPSPGTHRPAPMATQPPMAATARLRATLGALIQTTLRPPRFSVVWAIGVLGLAALSVEWLVAAGLLVIQVRRMQRQRGTYVRIRVPQATTGSAPAVGTDLFRAIHQVLAPEQAVLGQAPWISMIMSAVPDEPATFGVMVTGGDPARRATWVGAIRKAIRGLAPQAVVDQVDDPLTTVLRPGAWVCWQEYGTALPPQYPLRLHDDHDRSDLVGPLLSALQARQAVTYTEWHLTVRPRAQTDVVLNRGWRAAGLRRLLRMKAKADYTLAPDAQALEAKLEGLVYDTLIRQVAVVATRQDVAAARAELREGASVLGQYAARSGHRLQRLVRIGQGQSCVPSMPQGRGGRRGLPLLAAVGAGLACLPLLSQLRTALPQGRWPGIPLPAPILTALPAAFAALVPVLASLVALTFVQAQRGVLASSRVGRVHSRMPRALPLPPLLWLGRAWREGAVLAPHELSGLYHLPAPALGQLVRWLPCQHIPAPPHAFAQDEPDRLIIGTALHSDGTDDPVGLTLRDGREGLAFTGPPGTGKTRLLARIGLQLRRWGFFLNDGKGDDAGNLVAVMRQLIPLEDEGRTVILDVLDMDWPVGFNPLAGIDMSNLAGIDQVLGQIDSVFARLDPETWAKAPRMKDILRKGTLLVLFGGEQHPTLAHVKQALLDPQYRARLLERCSDVEIKTFWTVQAERGGEQQKSSLEALISRFDRLLDSELTRYLFNQATPAFSFREAIANQWIVLAPIPHRTLGGLAGPVGMLMFQAFMQAAFARPGSDQTRVEYGLICDEFQVLIENSDTKDVRDALTQVRSFGILTVIANQLLTQLGDLTEYALTAIANRVLMQTQEPDASVYASHYKASGITASDVANQPPNEHQYARIKCRGQLAGPFSMRPLGWLPPLPVAVADDSGPDWQTQIPPDSPTPAFDAALLQLVYGHHANPQGVAQALAAASGEQWAQLLGRWDAIRAYQRAYILTHPGCIPRPPRLDGWETLDSAAQAAAEAERDLAQRLARQQWLSRLLAARPRILAMAEYARIRPAIAPAPARQDGRGRQGSAQTSAEQGAGGSGERPQRLQTAHFEELERNPTQGAVESVLPNDFQVDEDLDALAVLEQGEWEDDDDRGYA